MIKIIKEGKKILKQTCPDCECEFIYEDEDIIKTPNLVKHHNCTLLFEGYAKSIECPGCHKEITLEATR